MHNPETVIDNETQKLVWDFGHVTRPSDCQQQKKRTCWIVDFTVQADHRVKLKESKKSYEYPDLAWELRRTMEHESDSDTNCNI